MPCCGHDCWVWVLSVVVLMMVVVSVVQELEDKILKLLKEAKGNILDDEVLINTLNNSKLTAGMIQNRLREAEETEDSINQVHQPPFIWPCCMPHECEDSPC